MTDLSKKELVSNLYDAFADSVAAKDKELKELHKYLTPAEQHENIVIDLTAEVKDAGWKVSPGIIDALCHGGAELMTMDLSDEVIIPPEPEVPAEPPAAVDTVDAPPREGLAPVAQNAPDATGGDAGALSAGSIAGGAQVEQLAPDAASGAQGGITGQPAQN